MNGPRITGTVLIYIAGWRRISSAHAGRGCRQPSCRQLAWFELNRGQFMWKEGKTRDNWWAYCEDHLYGAVWLEGAMWRPINLADSGWREMLEEAKRAVA